MVSSVTKSVQLPIGKLPWMSPYMKTIREHLCWQKLCLHSLHPKAKYYAIKTIQFCEDIFKRDVQLHKIDTVEQLGDIFTKSLTRFILNISGRRSWEIIPLTPHYSNVLVPVSRGSVVPGHWNLDTELDCIQMSYQVIGTWIYSWF